MDICKAPLNGTFMNAPHELPRWVCLNTASKSIPKRRFIKHPGGAQALRHHIYVNLLMF